MSENQITATVILPTTGDRGMLLPYSISSIQRQTVRDLEIFVIGDGVTPATRGVIHELMAADDRIRFFDHPKHPRRGEIYRHEALKEARGRIVAYLCDRDLMLPDHLANQDHFLTTYDLVISNCYDLRPNRSLPLGRTSLPFGEIRSPLTKEQKSGVYRLSVTAHTLAAYRALPEGWRTTPKDEFTDQHMWRQFLNQPTISVFHGAIPSIIYLKRGNHPGMSTEERAVDLMQWHEIIQDPKRWTSRKDSILAASLNRLRSREKEIKSVKQLSRRLVRNVLNRLQGLFDGR